MSETTPDADLYGIDPAEFGPETIDGERPEGTEAATPSADADPGDPDLDADVEAEPSS
jgi:hypothetical protein